MDGAFIIDKPHGITSHDVVAAARRLLREKRIGHAGTLDPLATGVLVLICGRATRLARFLSASEKTYEATILFGTVTDTYDVTGTTTARSDTRPTRAEVEQALVPLRGDYLQAPPAFSAKKVDGQRAYALARRQAPVALDASPVRVSHAELTHFEPDRATVVLTCSAGFYVRSFAHALGHLVGSGACLEALRRTRSGVFSVEQAVSLEQWRQTADPWSHLVPMADLLNSMPAAHLTATGREWVAHGRALQAAHVSSVVPATGAGTAGSVAGDSGGWIRLIDPDGGLVAVAHRDADGALHPSVVLI